LKKTRNILFEWNKHDNYKNKVNKDYRKPYQLLEGSFNIPKDQWSELNEVSIVRKFKDPMYR
jgi:hypothetical protein